MSLSVNGLPHTHNDIRNYASLIAEHFVGIILLNCAPCSPTAYSDRLRCSRISKSWISTSALLVLRGNIIEEKHSFNGKQSYSLEDYIEASLVTQLSIIDTG